jgi:hypothetical protein
MTVSHCQQMGMLSKVGVDAVGELACATIPANGKADHEPRPT